MFSGAAMPNAVVQSAVCSSRVIVFGATPLANALEQVVALLRPDAKVMHPGGEADLLNELGTRREESDVDVMLVVLPSVGEELYREVLRLQFKVRGCKWRGGLVAVTMDSSAVSLLREEHLFGLIAGQSVVGFPLRLPDILESVNQVGFLYPNRWRLALEQSRLAGFWRIFKEAEDALRRRDCAVCADALLRALAEVIDQDLLKRMVPHATVLPELRKLRESLSRFDRSGARAERWLKRAFSQVEIVMAPYRCGG